MTGSDTDLTIAGGTIGGNHSLGRGGGVFLQAGSGSSFHVDGSTISGNTAGNGGGLYAQVTAVDARFTAKYLLCARGVARLDAARRGH